MLSVAVSWDLYIQTRSAIVLGNVGLVQVAPSFAFAILAGHIADRYSRRMTMLLAQGLAVFASLLLAAGVHGVAGFYTCLFLISVARTFQWPIRLAILPDIVPPEALSNAITGNATVFETASISGPALAGLILTVAGSRVVYVVQCVCALIVLLCFLGLGFKSRRRVLLPDESGNPPAPSRSALQVCVLFATTN